MVWPWYHFALSAMAVLGVYLNNHKRRGCFYLWMVTNAAWGLINYSHGLPVEALQNTVFLGLAFHGWWKWK
jgi:hypothetical protein